MEVSKYSALDDNKSIIKQNLLEICKTVMKQYSLTYILAKEKDRKLMDEQSNLRSCIKQNKVIPEKILREQNLVGNVQCRESTKANTAFLINPTDQEAKLLNIKERTLKWH